MAFPEFSFAFNTLQERGQIVEGILFKSDPLGQELHGDVLADVHMASHVRRMHKTQSRLIS